MNNKRPHIFKYKWWLIFIPILPVGAVGFSAAIYKWDIPAKILIALLTIIGISSWLLMMYLSWQPHQEHEKIWMAFSEEFRINQYLTKICIILGVLFAWLGVGTLLILLPYWIGRPLNGLDGGFIQFIGMCWIVVWLYSIMNVKSKK